MDLDRLDRERGGPMRVKLNGECLTLPPASDLGWREVFLAIEETEGFVAFVWPRHSKIPVWKAEIAHARWVEHNGLPDADSARWLASTLTRYYGPIELDLMSRYRLRLGDIWRDRRWRELVE